MQEDVYELFKQYQFNHWWFTGRRKVIHAFMRKFICAKNLEILDIGSGYGGLIPTLQTFGVVDTIEPHTATHEQLEQLGIRTIYGKDFFPIICPEHRYDIVTLFDVLEHIEDDSRALQVVRNQLLKKQGYCFLTVPAHPGLWTEIDERSNHFRRYTIKRLRTLLLEAGFTTISLSYFMCLLFPMDILNRKLQQNQPPKLSEIKQTPALPATNNLLETIFGMESALISRVHFPVGSSIIAKAEG
ncbi:MAG: class I SAM-dependent methyltransferase [Candidatus Thermoplasmatota archaeon]|nr:class I SAM-dependent methyltransferase [Candidatus Thermoplasmatota archaeon]